MVNKPFWHISDFVLASYTFGCVKISGGAYFEGDEINLDE